MDEWRKKPPGLDMPAQVEEHDDMTTQVDFSFLNIGGGYEDYDDFVDFGIGGKVRRLYMYG